MIGKVFREPLSGSIWQVIEVREETCICLIMGTSEQREWERPLVESLLKEAEDRVFKIGVLLPGIYKVEVSRVTMSSLEFEVEVSQPITLDQLEDLARDQAVTEDFPAPSVADYQVEGIKDEGGNIMGIFL